MVRTKNDISAADADDWIRQHGGADILRPRSSRLIGLFANMVLNFILLAVTVTSTSPALRIFAAILSGINWCVTGLFVHELVHGYILKSRNLQKVIALPCMYYSMLAPSFWSHWHMIHHRFGTLDENVSGFQTINWARTPRLKALIEYIRPADRGLGAIIYLFFWKSVATIINQFLYFLKPRFKKKINRYRMATELGLLISAHLVVWLSLTGEQIVLIEVIPWLVQNFCASAIVVTNHHPSLIRSGACIQNSCSVQLGTKWLDQFILNSGYHIEHHLAPHLGPRYLPDLSKHLTKITGGTYQPLSIVEAHRIVFTRS